MLVLRTRLVLTFSSPHVLALVSKAQTVHPSVCCTRVYVVYCCTLRLIVLCLGCVQAHAAYHYCQVYRAAVLSSIACAALKRVLRPLALKSCLFHCCSSAHVHLAVFCLLQSKPKGPREMDDNEIEARAQKIRDKARVRPSSDERKDAQGPQSVSNA